MVCALRPEARNRISPASMTLFFLGGAAGSALASVVWSRAGRHGGCLLGGGPATAGLVPYPRERVVARSPAALSR